MVDVIVNDKEYSRNLINSNCNVETRIIHSPYLLKELKI